MATGLISAVADDTLDALLATYDWIKLHVGDPGAAGTANPATETDRQQVTWSAASGGASANTAELEWLNVAGTEDYTYFTAWDANAAGNVGFSGVCTANSVTAGDDFVVAIGGLDVYFTIAS